MSNTKYYKLKKFREKGKQKSSEKYPTLNINISGSAIFTYHGITFAFHWKEGNRRVSHLLISTFCQKMAHLR